MVRIAFVTEKGRNRGVCSKVDRATDTTAAADGPALWFAFFPYKRDNPRSTVTGAEVDTNPVDKHREKFLLGEDVYVTPVGANTVFHSPGRLGKKGVVFALAYILSGMDTGPTLTHDDGAGVHELAVEDLRTQPLSR